MRNFLDYRVQNVPIISYMITELRKGEMGKSKNIIRN